MVNFAGTNRTRFNLKFPLDIQKPLTFFSSKSETRVKGRRCEVTTVTTLTVNDFDIVLDPIHLAREY
jgi:hypothetical protein